MKQYKAGKNIIDIKNKDGYYEFYVNGKLYRTCDSSEYNETLAEVEQELENEV